MCKDRVRDPFRGCELPGPLCAPVRLGAFSSSASVISLCSHGALEGYLLYLAWVGVLFARDGGAFKQPKYNTRLKLSDA